MGTIKTLALVLVIQLHFMLFLTEPLATHLLCIFELWVLQYDCTCACLSGHSLIAYMIKTKLT